jgi:feruloyl esterase
VGSETGPDSWNQWATSEAKAQGFAEFYRWMVFGDPKWQPARFDLDRDYPLSVERAGSLMDVDDPDLRAFTGRGGKLILYHGWNDAAIPAGSTLSYFEAVRARLGENEKDVQLFMVPGMAHCARGSGPDSFDMLSELDRWVEVGKAPEQVLATQYDAPHFPALSRATSKVVRTRPLCPWPRTAHYKGSGSTDDAANFACK